MPLVLKAKRYLAGKKFRIFRGQSSQRKNKKLGETPTHRLVVGVVSWH